MSKNDGKGYCGCIVLICFFGLIIFSAMTGGNSGEKSSGNQQTKRIGRFVERVEKHSVNNQQERESKIKDYKENHPLYLMPSYPYCIRQLKYRPFTGPLEIKTECGRGAYVIRLRDSKTNAIALDYFIPSGISATINVPEGSYTLNYMCGTEWYGEEEFFGVSGSCSRANSVLNFEDGSGYTITLYKVVHGNLRTESISRDDF